MIVRMVRVVCSTGADPCRFLSFLHSEPTATFYVWADISGLKEPLNDSLVFLEECLKRKVICVVRPIVFFGYIA